MAGGTVRVGRNNRVMAIGLDRTIARVEIERLVRDAVAARLGEAPGSPTEAVCPLLINISARHCHLTEAAVEALFGTGSHLTPMKSLYQEGAFAAEEMVTLIGPRSRMISNLRVLGPCREINQVELAFTDAIALGFDIPVRLSGDIAGTPGCMLMGPKGFFEMEEGVIRAAPHVHMSPADAERYGVGDGDTMQLRVRGAVGATFESVLVRVSRDFKLEVHIDTDEGNACGLTEDSVCELISSESNSGCGCRSGSGNGNGGQAAN
jgi:putative phosphotransacetylase